MGARDLLAELAAAGISLNVDGNRLVVRPASMLTAELRSAIHEAKPELLELVAEPARRFRLSNVAADRCHAKAWDDGASGLFLARAAQLSKQGLSEADAADLAERLHLRDVDGDDRVICLECARRRAGRPSRCAASTAAGIGPELGAELETTLQRCPGFQAAPA